MRPACPHTCHSATIDLRRSIIREASAKTKDGRIDQTDFLNHCVSSTRYSLFTPMEASIIFHFAGRGNSQQRLSLYDFAQLLDPRWKAPSDTVETKPATTFTSVLHEFAHSAYNFGLGGVPVWLHYAATLTDVGHRHRRWLWCYDRVPYRPWWVSLCFLGLTALTD